MWRSELSSDRFNNANMNAENAMQRNNANMNVGYLWLMALVCLPLSAVCCSKQVCYDLIESDEMSETKPE